MNKYILDENGQPVVCDDLFAWGRWYETAERHVALTHVTGDVKVSTVFLGLDHAFTHGEPVLWETMVFGGPHDGHCDRYTSRAAAEAGHAKAVELARNDLQEESPCQTS